MTAVAKVLLQLMTVVVNSLGRGVAITPRVFSFGFPFVFLLFLARSLLAALSNSERPPASVLPIASTPLLLKFMYFSSAGRNEVMSPFE